jgi:hypothetical protein
MNKKKSSYRFLNNEENLEDWGMNDDNEIGSEEENDLIDEAEFIEEEKKDLPKVYLQSPNIFSYFSFDYLSPLFWKGLKSYNFK